VKRFLKWFFLLAPLLCWFGLIGYCIVGKSRANKGMGEADGLVWGSGESKVTVRVVSNLQGEIRKHSITATKPNHAALLETEFSVDEDMWGGGFVKAMQADQDPELEVVAWGHHEFKESFFLDYVDGDVLKRPFNEASPEAREKARYWHETNVMNPKVPLFAFFPLAAYYTLAAMILLILRFVRRRRIPSSSSSTP